MRTVTVSQRPGVPLTVTDAEAAWLTTLGLVLTDDGAANNAVVAGTPIYRGGTP